MSMAKLIHKLSLIRLITSHCRMLLGIETNTATKQHVYNVQRLSGLLKNDTKLGIRAWAYVLFLLLAGGIREIGSEHCAQW